MFTFPSEINLIAPGLHRMHESPPMIGYAKGPRHFSFSDVRRTLGREYTDYRTHLPAVRGKKALILDLDETLIRSSTFPPHSRVEAFRTGDPEFYVFKRPGLDNFLSDVRSKFEIFVFTHGVEKYAKPIIDRLMPWLPDDHRRYRDACDGPHGPRKNLKILGRSKKDLILIDDSESALAINPQNTVKVTRWCGSPSDRVLIEWLPPILEKCARAGDVRTVIRDIAMRGAKRDGAEGIPIEL
jgi:Dullard-like phosphatase family protein